MKLVRILEQADATAQYYDLGKDFFSFTHAMDTATEDVKNRFEQAIAAKIKGKKIRARASRGYKQFEKDYEINVANVSLDDYYVVVVKGGNGKEYFLKPGFKVQILGQMEPEPNKQAPQQAPPPPATQPPPAPPQSQAPAPTEPVTQALQRESNELVHKYPVEKIEVDLQKWLPRLLANPNANLKRYIPRDGVSRTKDRKTVISYGITIPVDEVPALTVDQIKHALSNISTMVSSVTDIDNIYTLDKFDTRGGKYVIIIKKITNY